MKIFRVLAWLLGCFTVVMLALPLAASAQEGGGGFSREELSQMLAPVALYPDALLSQVLMGATYPLEIVEADRWVNKNPMLKGDNLDEALKDRDWDASVKALCHIPAVLGVMSERLEETTRLGDAFLAQEQEVMDTIQDLRQRARREGNLNSNDKQRVTVQDDGTIVIEPADTETVYVPYYNTRHVYGSWWYPAWPPWYWGPDEVLVGGSIYFWPDFYFGFGYGFGYWSHFDWRGRTIIIDINRRPRFFRHDYRWDAHHGSWHHEPRHRRGVIYRDRPTAERFGQPPARIERAERQSTRGRVRGPVTGSGGSGGSDKAGEPLAKAGGRNYPERNKDVRPPAAGGDTPIGKTDRRGGSGEEAGRQDRGRAERRGEVAAAPPGSLPKVDQSRPAHEKRGRDGEVSPPTSRTRELRTDDERGPSPGAESRYDRRGGSSEREGRQSGERERGGGRR